MPRLISLEMIFLVWFGVWFLASHVVQASNLLWSLLMLRPPLQVCAAAWLICVSARLSAHRLSRTVRGRAGPSR